MASEDSFVGPVNLGNPYEFTILELAELILALTASKSKVVFKELPKDDPKQRQPDISLARQRLSWQPNMAIRDGLIETINYFRGK